VEFNVYAGAKIPQIKFVATVNDSETTPTDPPDFLKIFLDKGPQSGSFVLAFVDNWGRFNNTTNDYLENFEMYIGFCLKEDDAGSLVTGNIGKPFRGLDQPNKAIFVNRQSNTQILFRPFVT